MSLKICALIGFVWIVSVSAYSQTAQNEQPTEQTSTVFGTVLFDGEPLFTVYGSNGEFNAQDRATIITNRLKELQKKGGLNADSFKVIVRDSAYFITYSGNILFEVRHGDANALGMSKAEAADSYLKSIRETLEGKSVLNTIKSIIINIFLSLLIIGLVYFLVRYMNKLFRVLNVKLLSSNSRYIRSVKIGTYEFLSRERLLDVLSLILSGIKWATIALVVYLALPLLFSLFPKTEGIARTLFSLILHPIKKIVSGFIGYFPNLITIAVIAFCVHYAVRFLRFLAGEIKDEKLVIPGFYPDWALPTFQILRFILYAFGFVMIFPYLPGSDSPIFRGVSVFLGVLVSFGSGSAISNAVAGVVITYMRPFKLGDRVKIGEVSGDVIEKSLLVTRVRTIKNEDITIPNSTILNSHTINYSSLADKGGVILYTSVTIGYDVPWTKVHEMLIDAARKTEMVEKNPEPFVLQTSLDDFYVSYQLNCYTRIPSKAAIIYSNLQANIQDVFRDNDVEIMSPHYRAHRDGPSTIPPKV